MQRGVGRRDFLTAIAGVGASTAIPVLSWAAGRQSGPALRIDPMAWESRALVRTAPASFTRRKAHAHEAAKLLIESHDARVIVTQIQLSHLFTAACASVRHIAAYDEISSSGGSLR
jgi:hypothetical protein